MKKRKRKETETARIEADTYRQFGEAQGPPCLAGICESHFDAPGTHPIDADCLNHVRAGTSAATILDRCQVCVLGCTAMLRIHIFIYVRCRQIHVIATILFRAL
jgi:hypothetical protein